MKPINAIPDSPVEADVAGATDVSIRRYGDSDLEHVITIWLDGWASVRLPSFPVEKCRINAEHLRSSIPERVNKGGQIYVASFQSEVVAFIVLRENNLDQLFVAPRYQRKGIAKKLLEFAREIRPRGFWLHTFAASEDANRFYVREGLRRTGSDIDPELGLELVMYEWRPTP